MTPTRQQITEAKQYVLDRVEAELSSVSALDTRLLRAARDIIRIARKYNVPPERFRFSADTRLQREVDAVIARLKEEILSDIQTCSLASGKSGREEVIAFLEEKQYGKTLRQRIDTYARRWKYEIEAFIAAALIKGIAATSIENAYRQHYKNPYAFINGEKGAAVRLQGASYGAGRSNLSYNMLSSLSRNSVATAWMHADRVEAERGGATGFYSYRGSSYPCTYCDSKVGYHPISEFPGTWHPRCKCYFIFVNR